MEFTTQKIAENLWALDQKGVRSFFLVGQDNAVLVDTCFGGDILSVCRTLTCRPFSASQAATSGWTAAKPPCRQLS